MNGRSARASSIARLAAGSSPRRRTRPRRRDARAEHAGVQELEQAPELAEVVLDRRAAQRQPVLGRAAAARPWPTRLSAFLIACASSRIT